MNQFVGFFTILALFSLSSAQSINDFFGDDVDAGLVSFDPINIAQSQGIFGNNNQAGENSIGGIFAGEELTGRNTFDDFSVGGDLFVGGGGSDDEGNGNALGVPFFVSGLQDNVVDIVPVYGNGNADQNQVGQRQSQFQQGLQNLFN